MEEDASLEEFLRLMRVEPEHEHERARDREQSACSKNVLRKKRNWERKVEARKSKRKEEKQRKRESRQTSEAAGGRVSKRKLKEERRARLMEAREAGPRVCVDLSMTSRLTHKETSRLAAQIRRLYGSNRKASRPFHLYLSDLQPDSLLYSECLRMNHGFIHYMMDMSSESWFHLFPPEDVIYLTPDASEALGDVQEEKVFILGGLVDETIQKNLSYTRAAGLGVRTARLPVDEFMVKTPNAKNLHSKVLSINQVLDVLLAYRDSGDWGTALAAGFPSGKGFTVPDQTHTPQHQLEPQPEPQAETQPEPADQ